MQCNLLEQCDPPPPSSAWAPVSLRDSGQSAVAGHAVQRRAATEFTASTRHSRYPTREPCLSPRTFQPFSIQPMHAPPPSRSRTSSHSKRPVSHAGSAFFTLEKRRLSARWRDQRRKDWCSVTGKDVKIRAIVRQAQVPIITTTPLAASPARKGGGLTLWLPPCSCDNG